MAHAGDYDWYASRAGAPTSCSTALAAATAAINDAPLDDLEIEDEDFTADRVAAYENTRSRAGTASTASSPAIARPATSPA